MSEERNKSEIIIEKGGEVPSLELTITGGPPDLHKSPEKIQALLDLLETPKGTKVTVKYTAASVVVR